MHDEGQGRQQRTNNLKKQVKENIACKKCKEKITNSFRQHCKCRFHTKCLKKMINTRIREDPEVVNLVSFSSSLYSISCVYCSESIIFSTTPQVHSCQWFEKRSTFGYEKLKFVVAILLFIFGELALGFMILMILKYGIAIDGQSNQNVSYAIIGIIAVLMLIGVIRAKFGCYTSSGRWIENKIILKKQILSSNFKKLKNSERHLRQQDNLPVKKTVSIVNKLNLESKIKMEQEVENNNQIDNKMVKNAKESNFKQLKEENERTQKTQKKEKVEIQEENVQKRVQIFNLNQEIRSAPFSSGQLPIQSNPSFNEQISSIEVKTLEVQSDLKHSKQIERLSVSDEQSESEKKQPVYKSIIYKINDD